MNRSPIYNLLPLYLVIFLGFVGYSMMITIFTPMLLHGSSSILPAHYTISLRVIILGIILCLYPLGQFLGAPVFGAFSDHFGRKCLLMISLCAATVFYALISSALYLNSLIYLMIFCFLAGLSEANIVIAQGAIADLTHEKNRGRYFGYIYTSASFAYIIGPLFGGKLASWFGYAMPFWMTTFLLLANLVWTGISFKETHKQEKSKEKIPYLASLMNLFTIFIAKNIRVYYFANFLLYLSIFGFFRCYPMYLTTKYHMSVSRLSEYIAWVAVPIVLVNLWLTGFISRKFSPRKSTIISAVMTGIFMIVIIIPRMESALWVTLFLTAGALAVCLPSCAILLSTSVEKNVQGSVMGNNQSMQVAAESLSAIFGGLIAAIVVKLPLIIWGIIAVSAALILIFSRKEKTAIPQQQ